MPSVDSINEENDLLTEKYKPAAELFNYYQDALNNLEQRLQKALKEMKLFQKDVDE